MADEDKSLDDFFSKKKAKKGKGKGKFTTSDAITKQVGTGAQKDKEKTKEQASKKSSTVSQTPSKKDEDEWLDFVEPTQTDYSGLRIQSLQISEKDEKEANDANEQDEDGEEGDSSSRKEKSGPWQNQQSQTATTEVEVEKPRPTGVYRPPGSSSVYRPPGMRQVFGGGGRSSRAPEINSEIAFPSLQQASAAPKGRETTGGRSFETVRHGSRGMENPAARTPRLDLENKYDALGRS